MILQVRAAAFPSAWKRKVRAGPPFRIPSARSASALADTHVPGPSLPGVELLRPRKQHRHALVIDRRNECVRGHEGIDIELEARAWRPLAIVSRQSQLGV